MTRRIPIIFALAIMLVLPHAAAHSAPAFGVQKHSDRADGVDRVFSFEIKNGETTDLKISGRLILINVYDTSAPLVMPVDQFLLPKEGTHELTMRWSNAPAAGRVRALLVLTDGTRTFVESFDYLLFPFRYALYALGIILAAALAVIIMRLPKAVKIHVPHDMIAHTVEAGDTVVGLSNIFGVSWQDIVKANHLKPPYDLKPGRRIFIPKHPLQKP